MNAMLRLYFSVFAVACCGPLAAQPSATDLLERHLEWRGGRTAITGLRSLEMHQTVSQSGLEIDIRTEAMRNRLRVDYTVGKRRGSFALTDDDAWERDPLGRIVDMSSLDAEKRRFALHTIFLQHLLDPSWKRSAIGREKHDGQEWEVLRALATTLSSS